MCRVDFPEGGDNRFGIAGLWLVAEALIFWLVSRLWVAADGRPRRRARLLNRLIVRHRGFSPSLLSRPGHLAGNQVAA